ncbi:MAG: hypothetical protein ACRDT6_16875 [Micromonosporaceae bacterium]
MPSQQAPPGAVVLPPASEGGSGPVPAVPGTPAPEQPPAAIPRGRAIVLPPLSGSVSREPGAGGSWWERWEPPSWMRPLWLSQFRTRPGASISPGAVLVAALGSAVVIGALNALLLWAWTTSGVAVAVTLGLFALAAGATVAARRGKVFRYVAIYMQVLLGVSIFVGWWAARFMARAHSSLYESGEVPTFWPGVVVGSICFLGLFLLSGVLLWYVVSPQETQDRYVAVTVTSLVVLGSLASAGLIYWEHGHVSKRAQSTWVYSPSDQAQMLIVFEYYQGADSSAYSSIERQYNKIVCAESREIVGAAFAPLFELSANMALEMEEGTEAPETIDGDRATVTMRVIVIEDQRWDDGPHEIYHRGTWTFHFRSHGQGWCMDRIDTPPGYPPGSDPDAEPSTEPSTGDPDTPPSYQPPDTTPDYTPPTLPGEGETPTLPGETG